MTRTLDRASRRGGAARAAGEGRPGDRREARQGPRPDRRRDAHARVGTGYGRRPHARGRGWGPARRHAAGRTGSAPAAGSGAASAIPTVLLMPRRGDMARIIGLAIGMDVQAAKPFNSTEVVASIRAPLRRPQSGGQVPVTSVRSLPGGDAEIAGGRSAVQASASLLRVENLGIVGGGFSRPRARRANAHSPASVAQALPGASGGLAALAIASHPARRRTRTERTILRSSFQFNGLSEVWLGNLDSNQDRRSQSPLFYR